MTIEELDARLERLEQQNAALLRALGEVLNLVRARLARAPAPGPASDEPKRRWNANGWWEMFLEGTGWVRHWHNKAPAPEVKR